MEKQLTLEQKKQKVQDFRPIDDVFFEVLADDELFCQEILRIILEDEKLIVNDVIVQSSERNLYGRSVRLDALCTLGNGEKCNIEVQRSDNDNLLKRVRFNAASITMKESQVNNPKFPVFTSRMNRLKNEEGGLNIMCEVMQKYEQIAAKKERIEAIQNMIDLGLSEEKILTKYSKQEYEEAKQGMLVEA